MLRLRTHGGRRPAHQAAPLHTWRVRCRGCRRRGCWPVCVDVQDGRDQRVLHRVERVVRVVRPDEPAREPAARHLRLRCVQLFGSLLLPLLWVVCPRCCVAASRRAALMPSRCCTLAAVFVQVGLRRPPTQPAPPPRRFREALCHPAEGYRAVRQGPGRDPAGAVRYRQDRHLLRRHPAGRSGCWPVGFALWALLLQRLQLLCKCILWSSCRCRVAAAGGRAARCGSSRGRQSQCSSHRVRWGGAHATASPTASVWSAGCSSGWVANCVEQCRLAAMRPAPPWRMCSYVVGPTTHCRCADCGCNPAGCPSADVGCHLSLNSAHMLHMCLSWDAEPGLQPG